MRRRLCYGLGFCCLAILWGCGEGGPPGDPTVTVSGSVTFNDQPIEKGTISFAGEDDLLTGRPPASTEIVDGKYEMPATPGKKTVKIRAPQESGPADATGLVPTRESIPAKYNEKTELEFEIADDGPQQKDFQLTP